MSQETVYLIPTSISDGSTYARTLFDGVSLYVSDATSEGRPEQDLASYEDEGLLPLPTCAEIGAAVWLYINRTLT